MKQFFFNLLFMCYIIFCCGIYFIAMLYGFIEGSKGSEWINPWVLFPLCLILMASQNQIMLFLIEKVNRYNDKE